VERAHGLGHSRAPRAAKPHQRPRQAIEHATELRKRAKRRLGEMMAAQPKAKPPNPKPPASDRRVNEKPDE
jgi:hypothetical protein